MAKNIYVDVKTNIPEIITPKFRSWKEWENTGKNGDYKTYSIGVEWGGQDAYFSVGEGVYKNVFEPLGDLQDRTLEVVKYEDGKYKKWKVIEGGKDITPTGSVKNEGKKTETKTETNAQREWALKVASDIQELRARVIELEDEIDGLKGTMVNEDNEKAYEFHKGVTRGVKEMMEKKAKATPTEDGFVNEEGVEVITKGI